MSEFDGFKLGPTPSRVSFSRGLLKYTQEEPEVGRRTGMTSMRRTSTPKDEGYREMNGGLKSWKKWKKGIKKRSNGKRCGLNI